MRRLRIDHAAGTDFLELSVKPDFITVTNPSFRIFAAFLGSAALVVLPAVAHSDNGVKSDAETYYGANVPQAAYSESINALWSEYQAYITPIGQQNGFTDSNLHVCSAPNNIYVNGKPHNYCFTRTFTNNSPPPEESQFAALSGVCQNNLNYVLEVQSSGNEIYSCAADGNLFELTPPCPFCEGKGQTPSVTSVPNPIQLETQVEWEIKTDFDGPGLLKLKRYYSSVPGYWGHSYSRAAWNTSLNSVSNPSSAPGGCVTGVYTWDDGSVHTRCLPYLSNADLGRTGAPDIIVVGPDGRTVGFPLAGGQSMSLATHETLQVLTSGGNYNGVIAYNEEGMLEEYDAAGRLLVLGTVDGHRLVLTYPNSSGVIYPTGAPTCKVATSSPALPGQPGCVTDSITGRQLNFLYNSNGSISAIEEPSGAAIDFTFNGSTANGFNSVDGGYLLTGVTHQDSTTETYYYNESSLTSGATNLYSNMTGIEDENASRFAYFGYDTTGKAISTELSGGEMSYTFANGKWTDPLGAARTFAFDTVAIYASDSSVASSVRLSAGVTQPAGSGSNQASTGITYDTFGNPTLVTDFNGNATQYTYNSRNLEATRVEGYGTAVARTITSVWHPNYRLRIQMAEPLKMTYWVYNGQPDPTNGNAVLTCGPSGTLIDGNPVTVLCKRFEEDTLDTTGSTGLSPKLPNPLVTRTWSWTYNQNGQVLTAKDPLGNVTTTTYYASTDTSHSPAWYAAGDVNAVTDTLGHVTTFNQYDLNGRLLQMTDPNGVVTTLTYKPRGWLASRTVTQPSGGAETTTYTYDNVGQMTQVTLPDSTVLKYAYDPAHRLTTVTDSVGDTINYTLDGLGNRVGEQVKDPSSNLTRNIARVYDQLSRLQTVTGALQ